jgi:ATP-dependent Clp protease ATP-binding subunit ClpA
MIHKELQEIFGRAITYARANKHEYITVDHVFIYLLDDKLVKEIFENLEISINDIQNNIKEYIKQNVPTNTPTNKNQDPIETITLTSTIEEIISHAKHSGKKSANIIDMFVQILKNGKNYSAYLLKELGLQKVDILEEISHGGKDEDEEDFDEEDTDDLEDVIELNINRSKDKKSTLLQNSTELVELAINNHIDPVIGRAKEVRRVIEVLGRRKKNNPILLGETGVGKTAIAQGLALQIANQNVPDTLSNAKIFALDMGSMVAGTKYRGDFEKKLKNIIKDVKKEKNAILFIDEIHQLIGAGSVGGSSMDASNILKPMLGDGTLRVIGATTYEEYRNDFSKDKAFARRFAKIDVKEPNIEDTIKILDGIKNKYEEFHSVKYTPNAIKLCVELSKKFITDRYLPDSAIDVLDEVAVSKKFKINIQRKNLKITAQDVETTLSNMVQIPPKTATKSDLSLLQKLEQNLTKVVFGQDEAIKTIVKAIKINRAGLSEQNKPVGSFLFTGATGVGKTEVAKELANVMGIHFERFDMSEYSESHTISRLIGAPAGYVGSDKGGLLTEAIKKHPYCVLLLDEIEKAHPELMNILLQVMDNATLTDNNGIKSDFQNVILILTSNLGTKEANVMGFEKDDSVSTDKAIKAFFAPEFRNRLDEVVKFNSLNQDIIVKVVTKFINNINDSIKDKDIKISISLKAKKQLASLGYDKTMGARPLQRVIRDKIKEPITNEILFGDLKDGGKVSINFKENKFTFVYDHKNITNKVNNVK